MIFSSITFIYDYLFSFFFFYNYTSTSEIYTLSLHDALPICGILGRARAAPRAGGSRVRRERAVHIGRRWSREAFHSRSEEHTSELQSQSNLVCRLLLEKKKKKTKASIVIHEKNRSHVRDDYY